MAQRKLIEKKVRDIHWADPEAVEELAREWDEAVLQCRNYGHPWQPLRAVINRQGWVDVRELCPRCTSERYYEMSPRGKVYGSPQIDYADGYLAVGLGRIAGEGKQAIRAQAVERLFSDVTVLSEAESRLAAPHKKKTREALGMVQPTQKRKAG